MIIHYQNENDANQNNCSYNHEFHCWGISNETREHQTIVRHWLIKFAELNLYFIEFIGVNLWVIHSFDCNWFCSDYAYNVMLVELLNELKLLASDQIIVDITLGRSIIYWDLRLCAVLTLKKRIINFLLINSDRTSDFLSILLGSFIHLQLVPNWAFLTAKTEKTLSDTQNSWSARINCSIENICQSPRGQTPS